MFFNRQRNRVKLLVWERDGFWLLYKRLEARTFARVDGTLDYPSVYDDTQYDVAILHTLW